MIYEIRTLLFIIVGLLLTSFSLHKEERIFIGWKGEDLNLVITVVTSLLIHARVELKIVECFCYAVVYGFSYRKGTVKLWKDMATITRRTKGALIVDKDNYIANFIWIV